MPTYLIVILVILVVLIIALVALTIVGKRLMKRRDENQELMQAHRQEVTMLVLAKGKAKIKDSGLPQQFIDSTPKLYRRSKVCTVKAKVGPQVLTFICDAALFDQIPEKKEIKAGVSGLYILDVKGIRTGLEKKPTKEKLSVKLKNSVKNVVNKETEEDRLEKQKEEKRQKRREIKERQRRRSEEQKAKNEQLKREAENSENNTKKNNKRRVVRGTQKRG